MKTFKFDQYELGYKTNDDRPIDHTREAARAVLKNDEGRIAVMYFNGTGSYKLPGGGIDEGETVHEALVRELREETGYELTDIKELCTYEEDRYFCGMHQISYCFTANVTDFVGTELTEKERSRGMELRWARDHGQAIEWIESGKTPDDSGEIVGLKMMILRDSTIVRYAAERTA